jgi:hypothetical protein
VDVHDLNQKDNPMKISNAFPSKYIKAADLQDRQHEVIMHHVELENIGDDDRKPVLFFAGKQKGLVLNKTNSRTIAGAYGDDTDEWAGKKVILFPAMVDFRGDQVEAIRVKIPKVTSAKAPPQDSENPGDDMDDEIPF